MKIIGVKVRVAVFKGTKPVGGHTSTKYVYDPVLDI